MQTQPIVITRTFNASPEEVQKVWLEPEKLKKWWGPKNFTAPSIESDPRPGGKYLYAMKSPEGEVTWSTGTFKEVSPERVVTTDSFADEQGNIVPASHYGMEGIPDELLITATFEKQGDKTKFTLKHEGFPPGEMRDMCIAGWNESLDKMEALFKPEQRNEASL
ncbi:hypothetical protein D3C87_1430470 [compost metagenome]